MNEVKEEEPPIFDFKCGGAEAGKVWAEPKNGQASALYLDANFEKAFKIDDISSVFHYELIDDIGGLNSYVIGEENDELRCGDLDGMLDEDRIAKLKPTVSHRNALEDFILDVEFSEKVPELDYQFCEELNFGNSSSEIHNPVISNEAIQIPVSSIPAPKCSNNQFVETTSGGMHDVAENKCGCEIMVKDEMDLKCSLACELQLVHEIKNVGSIPEAVSSLDHNMKTTCSTLGSMKPFCTSACMLYDEVHPVSEDLEREDVAMDDLSTDSSSKQKIAIARQRRLRKPPQRYIEGSPWFNSRHNNSRKCSTSSSKDTELEFCSQRKYHRKTKTSKAIKSNLELDSDDEYDPLPSTFNIKKSKKRSYLKKTNNVWTLAEVVNLVDGIGHFGLGQWTAIKRAFFSSSGRTATDVRDKWRNLVKSNCRNLRSKRKDDQQLRNGAQLLPKAVIERVRELAIAHPISKYGSISGAKLLRSRRHEMSASLHE